MRRPSSRVLRNRIDLYICVSSQSDGGFQQVPPTIPTMAAVPCSVQYQGTAIDYDDQKRLTSVNTYWVLFAGPSNLSPRDIGLWTDDSGVQHTLIVDGLPPSEAGRDSAYTVRFIERT